MQSQPDRYLTPLSVDRRHSQCLSEFVRHLSRTGLADATINNLCRTTRHFLCWLKSEGKKLRAIDQQVLLEFRDHDCGCLKHYAGVAAQLRKRGLAHATLKRVFPFVQFLEDSGYTAHPGEGELGSEMLEAFLRSLEARGYRAESRRHYGSKVRHFLDWLHRTRTPLGEVNEQAVKLFMGHDCVCLKYWRTPDTLPRAGQYAHVVGRFASFLADQGLGAGVAPERPTQYNLSAFCRWLERHRGIQAATIRRYDNEVSSLLADLGTDPSRYDASLIRKVLLDRFSDVSVAYAKNLASRLRMYLRYLVSTGACPPSLIGAVPMPRQWRRSRLPHYLPRKDIERVIASCDTGSMLGIRNRAILLLLARLGLRASDVCLLRFSDIDWRNAHIRVCGKSKRDARLPLPQEVGDALLQYLRSARPPADTDRVFLRRYAPHRPFAHSSAVSILVRRALKSAGVQAPGGGGSHLLRHSAATHWLRSGASMEVIGALLRHESAETTAIYAKVNVRMLQTVAQAWPGGAR